MESIKQLLELDFVQWVYTCFIVIAGIVAILTLIENFTRHINKPIKWLQGMNKDHELLINTVDSLLALKEKQAKDVERSIRHDKELKNDLAKLTQMFVDKEIDDLRWELLDFGSALSAGRSYSQEQFNHVFSIYAKYEKILEEHGLTNGQVVATMDVINEVYKEHLKNGF